MKQYLMGALAVAATLAFAGQVDAAEIDMTKITCKDVEAMDAARTAAVGMWMSGFAAGKANKPMVDTDKMRANAEKIQAACAKNPGASVMEVISKM
jgi:acid stress chaperone HdeB